MPTPVTAARACLTPDASSALDAAVSTARRRSHAQTTSLHFISSLLSTPLLRDALSRSRSSAYSPRLQFKALELCFSVALDRLPSCSSSTSSSAAPPLDEPPVSNSLMAAIKRSQANQRRNPDTFHLYQQHTQTCPTSTSTSFSGVKVELQQLILAILDDPVVSRVFGEAGFRSSDIKLAVLRPAPPPILRFPRRCPPLFLCSFSNGSDDLIGSVASSGDEHCRTIADILSRDSGNGRNPMLVGAGASDAARDFSAAIVRRNWSLFPPELEGIQIFDVELDQADRIEEIVDGFCDAPGPGVVLNVGDLNALLEGDKAGRVVSEVSRVLELKRGRLWVMGWSVNYETYLKFLSKYPLVDKDWELRILPITPSARANGTATGYFNKAHSFVPFGGFFPETFEPVGVVSTPYQYQPGSRCQSCNFNYEQEAMTILKASSTEAADQARSNLPSWMSKSNSGAIPSGVGDIAKASEDNKLVLNSKIANLQKKWTDYCHRLHTSYSPRLVAPESNYPLIPGFVPVPQSPAMVTVPKPNRPIQSISLPSSTNQKDEDLISKLQPRHSKSEQLHLNGSEGHASPSSATSVTTDLALATPRGPPLDKTESPKLGPYSRVNLDANSVSPSHNMGISDVNSYKSIFADLFKRVGRQEEALKHISATISSRANPNTIPSLSRRAIWLGFQGGDHVAQKRVASALAEVLSGRTDNLISVDLSKCDLSKCFNARNHGKTSIDYIANEIARMPSAVVYIENVDKADFLEQGSLEYAVNNGKLQASNHREIGIGGRIFLLSSRRKDVPSTRKHSDFAEENIRSAKGRKMKIVMESTTTVLGSASNGRVVISRRSESGKRKSNTCYGSPKRLHLRLDLNLPIDDSKDEPENNSTSEDDSDAWVDELFEKLDQKVEFSSFNYDALADEVLWSVNKVFCEIFGSGSRQLEIEIDAMEQILAVEERRTIFEWVETVLGESFGELKQRCSRFLGSAVFRLVACEKELLREGECLPRSSLLPCKIIIN